MESIIAAVTFVCFLLLSVDFTLAQHGQDIKRNRDGVKPFLTQTTEATIEGKILRGPVTPTDYDKIGKIIFDVLSESPDHVAQIDAETGNQITYSYMKNRSIRLAVWMKKLAINPNDIIVECAHNNIDTYVPLFATFFVDAVFSAWPKNIPLDKAQKLMQQYAPKVIFTDEEAADTLLQAARLTNSSAKLIVFGKHSSMQSLSETLTYQTKEEIDKFTPLNEKSSLEAAVILLTSGTTGIPKGVLLSGKSITTIAKGSRHIGTSKPLRVLWYTQIIGISSLRLTLQTTVQKNVQVVASTYDEDRVLKTIEKYNVDIVRMPNSLVHTIAKSSLIRRYNIQSLKVITISGSKFNRHILEKLQQNFPSVLINNLYGTTETGGTISERNIKNKHIDSVGFVIPNVQVKFVDMNSHELLGPNEVGEICVKSPTLMIEYYKNPEMTKQVIDREGWYHTGDVGNYVENGEIFVLDRVKHLIKYKNYSILPSEIESTLFSDPDVEQATVVSIPHRSDGNWPVAFVKKVPGSNVSKNKLMKVMSKLEDYKQLRGGIYFLDQIPFDSAEKVARNELINIAKIMENQNSM